MNIWIIAHNAGSPYHGPNLRLYYLARRFVEMGHPTSVISASYFHKYFEPPKVDGELTYETIDGITYCWVRTRPYQSSWTQRFLNHAEFVIKVRRHERRFQLPQPDAVIGSSPHPLITYNCVRIARRYNIPFIFDVRDLWPLTLIEIGGLSRFHPVVLGLEYFERLGYRRANHVVSVLPGARGHMEAKGVASEKFVHIPNGVDIEEIDRTRIPLDETTKARLNDLRDRFVVAYVGSYSISNALHTLLAAAELLQQKHPKVHFVLVGKGPLREDMEDRIAKSELRNVSMWGPVSKNQVPSLLERVDVCYAGVKRNPLYEHGVSLNKLFDYMLASRPIIQAISTPYDLVEEAECGFSVEAEDPDAVAGAIVDLVEMSPDEREQLGRNGREYVDKHHSWARLAQRYLSLLRS